MLKHCFKKLILFSCTLIGVIIIQGCGKKGAPISPGDHEFPSQYPKDESNYTH